MTATLRERTLTLHMQRHHHNAARHPSASPRRLVTNRLWRHRTEHQLSQRDIARLLGIKNSAQVSRWENGDKIPTLDNALMLSCILKTPVEVLFAERLAELQAAIDTRTPGVRPPVGRPPARAQ